MNDRTSTARQAALVAIVFVATLGLLAGGWAALGRAREAGAIATATPLTTATPPTTEAPPGSPSGSVPSQPLASGEVPTITLTGAGEIAECPSNGAKLTSDLLLAQQGSFFTAGDNALPDGSDAAFGSCYAPTWGRVLDRTILPTAGALDWATAGAAGYLEYFGRAAAPQGVTWYSTDLGAWHVVVLDSACDRVGGCGLDSPQGRWLSADLSASSARCTLAIWNRPRFSSAVGPDPEVAPFWDLLHRDGAELVVNAGAGSYERFGPQDPSGNAERPGGIWQIVVGTGGAPLQTFHASAANSEVRLSGEWGVLRLTLHAADFDWEFLPVAGQVTDGGSALCH